MITIQGFAKLCGCNTQTLRYYDRIGLLIPAKVDEWTGYRYYEEGQALQFVKIKSLQQADFSINEIRQLLAEDDDALQAAFERKIAEQEDKLVRIRKIQKAYLKDTMEMQQMICMLADFMQRRANDPRLREEFGLDAAQGAEVGAKANEILTEWLTQIRAASEQIARQCGGENLDVMKSVMEVLSKGDLGDKNLILSVTEAGGENTEEIPANAEKLFECSGWAHVSEWLDELPRLDNSKRSFFVFRVREDSAVSDPGFPIMLLAVMASKFDVLEGGVQCKVGLSDDGANHVAVLRK